MLLGVKHLVRNARALQDFRNGLRFFDGNRSHQHRLPTLMIVLDPVRYGVVFLQNAVDHRFELFFFSAIYNVGIFDAD